tara:strand:+ start:1052 stop:1204 length:153 start_codon:yes stop_codon:yes gene_type:complete
MKIEKTALSWSQEYSCTITTTTTIIIIQTCLAANKKDVDKSSNVRQYSFI